MTDNDQTNETMTNNAETKKRPSETQFKILETADSTTGRVKIPKGLQRTSLNALIRSGHVEYRHENLRPGIPVSVPYITPKGRKALRSR